MIISCGHDCNECSFSQDVLIDVFDIIETWSKARQPLFFDVFSHISFDIFDTTSRTENPEKPDILIGSVQIRKIIFPPPNEYYEIRANARTIHRKAQLSHVLRRVSRSVWIGEVKALQSRDSKPRSSLRG